MFNVSVYAHYWTTQFVHYNEFDRKDVRRESSYTHLGLEKISRKALDSMLCE